MIPFIITIDTEGDNLWNWSDDKNITTENSLHLPRFQELCNEYGFKPVWLTNWEMLHDDRFIQFALKEEEVGHCEIGMHLHAWNTPPFYKLPKGKDSGLPYLIEYPDEVLDQKIDTITEEFKKITGHQPISHRAGRWAINDTYMNSLYRHGYQIDCSITPGIDWGSSMGQTPGFKGSDYRDEKLCVSKRRGIVEIPLTTFESDDYFEGTKERLNGISRLKYQIKSVIRKKRILSLRPDGTNLAEMKWIAEKNKSIGNNYLMFMIHSSELMPGGSPTFPDENSIESLYGDLKDLFSYIAEDHVGKSLKEYHRELAKNE